ncbi:MAG: methyltransferase domain-containing protein [Fibrobacteria bacterium]
MPSNEGWLGHPDARNPWANDRKLLELYRRRCRRETEEMTSAAQAAEIIAETARPGESLLDAGCGGGYYYWSFQSRAPGLAYHGLDHTPAMVELATVEMAKAGLPAERFQLGDIADLEREFDHTVCFHVLATSPHYAHLLDRLLACTRKRLVLRESLADTAGTTYQADAYLDEDKQHIQVYHNTYAMEEMKAFIEARGFSVVNVPDKRSKNGMEMVCDVPHWWKILVADRRR